MRIFKIEGYVLDPNDKYDKETIQDTIEIDALASLVHADSFVKVLDRSSNNCDKNKDESEQNLHCEDCKYWVPIENTADMIFSGLTVDANGFCHKLNSWIDKCDYRAYFDDREENKRRLIDGDL